MLLRARTMRRRFFTLDVFTTHRFAGNPLAVVLEPDGLDTTAMQSIAREFGHPETVFVFPPGDTGAARGFAFSRQHANCRLLAIPRSGPPSCSATSTAARRRATLSWRRESDRCSAGSSCAAT